MGRVRAHARRELLLAAAAFVLCALGLSLLHRLTRPHYRLSAAAAIAAARANPSDRAFLARNPVDRARVIPLDAKLQRVTFFAGSQVVLDAAVGEHGEVLASEQHTAGAPASGAALANSPWVLALFTGLFLLATTVVPLRRVRNLDALALAGLTVTVVLVNDRQAGASVICAWVLLCYLLVRCLRVGLRTGAGADAQATPLLSHLCAGWGPRRRVRLLRALVAATALAFLLITLTSSGYTDVALASLQGATEILHGVLPYGHVTLALHGDTYPLGNYLLYVPGALWHPVSDAFSNLEGSLATTAAASLLAGLALYRLPGADRPGADRPGGEAQEADAEPRLRATLAWFAFPPVLLAASGGANDLLVAACVAWMLALGSRRPAAPTTRTASTGSSTRSGLRQRPGPRRPGRRRGPSCGASLLMLAVAAWIKLVPLVALVVWVPYRRRELPRSLAGAGALTLALMGVLAALGGPGAIGAMARAMAFQFQRGSFFAPWYTFGLQWLQPLAQAAVLVLALVIVGHLRAHPSARQELARVSALAGALLLGVQLSANYWTWSYLPWLLPFVYVALFARGGYAAAPTLARSTPITLRRRESAVKAKALVSSME